MDTVSVVTPTLRRPDEVNGLLENVCRQTVQPVEIVLVDGAPSEERETEKVVRAVFAELPFDCVYIRHGGGTAIQRNVGIDAARGDFIAFIDDDVRLEPDFLRIILEVFRQDEKREVGGIVGYRTNKHFRLEDVERWRWYRRLRLLTTYEPGRYDFKTGYPINANMQPPFSGVREVDFMTTACAVWRRDVFDEGLRFDEFFRNYGVLEDAHLSLRAGQMWRLLQCGDAHCQELSSPKARENARQVGYKGVVNYYYVFQSIVTPLTWQHRARFWRYQAFVLLHLFASGVRHQRWVDFRHVQGRLEGAWDLLQGRAFSFDR